MTDVSVPDDAGGVAAAPAVLRTRNLTWKVDGFTIVRDLDLDVRPGELLSVIGPNGAGKSTLINLLSGVHRPTAGTIEINGRDVTRLRPARRTRLGIARTYQTSSLFPRLTVHENARLAAQAALGGALSPFRRPRFDDPASERAWAALATVGLMGRAGWPVLGLNHGDKRKLEIAVVLCSEPEVVLLDEPTSGVSVEDVGPLVDVIQALHERGRTVVMVEHRIELVTSMSDRIAVMHHGELIACDAPEIVAADLRVQDAYLGTDHGGKR